MQSFVLLLLVALAIQAAAFGPSSYRQLSRSSHSLRPNGLTTPSCRKTTHLKAAEGLSADALNALGSVSEVSENADAVVDISASMGSIMLKLTASPFIVVVPILAGSLVAFGIGFFIYWYGRGGE